MDRHSPTVKCLRDQVLTVAVFPRCCDAATKTLRSVPLNRSKKTPENACYRVWHQHIAAFALRKLSALGDWHSKCFSPGPNPQKSGMNLKLRTIRILRPLLDSIPSDSPRLAKLRRRLELGELYRTDLVRYRVERAKEMGATIGKNCRFFSLHIFSEPRLVEIGDNTIMSGNVVLLTHDGAIHSAAYVELPDINGYYGRISIGKNCFIGFGTIIMPNVRIGDNTIVCPGSVVIESVPENSVVRGNPARVVSARSAWVRNKEQSPNTIVDPVYRFPIVIPEDVLMERVGQLAIAEPRMSALAESAAN